MTSVAVHVALLGGFRVTVGGVERPAGPGRRAAELVQLLALAEARRLHRDEVVEALWPHLTPEAGAANLRKAAHHARHALGDPAAVVLRAGRVVLFPDASIDTDVAAYEAAAATALAGADAARCLRVARTYSGELLPEARYEEWTQTRRAHLHALQVRLLRAAGAWEALLALEPADEPAHCALMRQALEQGHRSAAVRWYGRLCVALERDLGVRPGREAQALHARCVDALARRPGLVGRHDELARAEGALLRAARLELSALVVRGPGGIGKSALCAAFGARARALGWGVVPVTAVQDAGPYAPLVAAVEHVLRDRPDLTAALPPRTCSVLAALTPLVQAGPLDGPLTRHQVIGAVRLLLQAAGTGSGLVLVVDDAHLLDDDDATALLHLAGASPTRGLLLVLAHRPAPDRTALISGVARLERAGVAALVDLGPLATADATALVTAALGEQAETRADVVGRVVDLAAGNPFFLLELAGSAHDAALPAGPARLWAAVTSRLVDVDAPALDALQRLAVAGGQVDAADVVAVSGLSEQEAFRVLDTALAAEVLVVRGSRYAFRHDLVRQALLAQVPPHRRAGVHRDAARGLELAGGAPEAVARHWLAGERPAQALPYLAAAARRALRWGAYADALARLDVLLEHAPQEPAALLLRAEALEALGDPRAPAAFAAAARVAPAEGRDDVLARQALASVRAGDPAAAVVVLRGVEARTLEGRLAQALASAGTAAMGHADPAQSAVRAVETRRLALASGDPSAVVIASWAEAAAAHAGGVLPDTLLAGLRETYALPQLAITTFDGHLCVAERLLYGGRPYADVHTFAGALEAEAERLGAQRGRAFAVTLRGEVELLTGRLGAAGADLERGVELHRAIGASAGQSLSLQRLAEVALHAGDRVRAGRLLDESLALARDSGLGFHLFDRIYGSRITAAADPSAALAALDEAEDAVHGAMETCPGCRITLAVPAALAAAAAGDVERALRHEATAENLTELLMRLPGWYASLDEVRGQRALAEGDRDAAVRHLRAAAERFRAVGQPLDRTRCERDAALLG
ncbi:MAG TPA: AAA family ATPase [Mycobacteriales bacterium]|nr:AAA family ATPase [Mycobacteriales bacterium]